PLVTGERSSLSQDEIGHADLADVVDRRQPGDEVDRLGREKVAEARVGGEILAERLHVFLRAEEVAAGLVIARVRERRQGIEQELPCLPQILGRSVGASTLPKETGQRQHWEADGERNHRKQW